MKDQPQALNETMWAALTYLEIMGSAIRGDAFHHKTWEALERRGLAYAPRSGCWEITEAGKAYLADQGQPAIDPRAPIEVAEPAESVQDALNEADPSRDTQEAPKVAQRPAEGANARRKLRVLDVVRIHKETNRYIVRGVSYPDRLARLEPCDPSDQRPSQWVSMDILHRVPPVTELKTEPIVGAVAWHRQARDVVKVQGSGWRPDVKRIRQIGVLEHADGTAHAFLLAADTHRPLAPEPMPVATIQVGDPLIIDGREYRVIWHGSGSEPSLTAEKWRW